MLEFYRNYQVRLWLFNIYDYKSAEDYLKKKATAGYELVTIIQYLFTIAIFRKCSEPVNKSYRVDIKRSTTFEENTDYIDDYDANGYRQIPSAAKGLIVFEKDSHAVAPLYSDQEVFNHLGYENVDDGIIPRHLIWGILEIFIGYSVIMEDFPIINIALIIHGATKLIYVMLNLITYKLAKNPSRQKLPKQLTVINMILSTIILIPRILITMSGFIGCIFILTTAAGDYDLRTVLGAIVIFIAGILLFTACLLAPLDEINLSNKHSNLINYASMLMGASILIANIL